MKCGMIKGSDSIGRRNAVLTLPFSAVSHTAADTQAVGAALGHYLLSHQQTDAFLALYGDLGAGKTAFVRGLASVITPGAHVCSPTYTIVNEYHAHGRTLCHLDLYRIESEDDLYSIGFYDYEGVMMAAEWCEKAPFALPPRYLRVRIDKIDEESRAITIEDISA